MVNFVERMQHISDNPYLYYSDENILEIFLIHIFNDINYPKYYSILDILLCYADKMDNVVVEKFINTVWEYSLISVFRQIDNTF
jgi:hypothetical protein